MCESKSATGMQIPVLVSDLDLECQLWLKIRLAPMTPYFGTVSLAFVGPPTIKVQLLPYNRVRLMRVPIVQVCWPVLLPLFCIQSASHDHILVKYKQQVSSMAHPTQHGVAYNQLLRHAGVSCWAQRLFVNSVYNWHQVEYTAVFYGDNIKEYPTAAPNHTSGYKQHQLGLMDISQLE